MDIVEDILHRRALEIAERTGKLYGDALRVARREYQNENQFKAYEKQALEGQAAAEKFDLYQDRASEAVNKFYRHKPKPENMNELVRKLGICAQGGADIEKMLKDNIVEDIKTYSTDDLGGLVKRYSRTGSRRTVRRY